MGEKRTVPGKVCPWCGRFLPVTYFPLKNKTTRYRVCRDCYKVGHSCKRPEPKPTSRKVMTPEEKAQHKREYQRKYRAEHREKVRKITRESLARKRAGEPKRKSGPPKGTSFVKIETPVPKHERMCETSCKNWPCFKGIETLESDFARYGCHGFRWREEMQDRQSRNSAFNGGGLEMSPENHPPVMDAPFDGTDGDATAGGDLGQRKALGELDQGVDSD